MNECIVALHFVSRLAAKFSWSPAALLSGAPKAGTDLLATPWPPWRGEQSLRVGEASGPAPGALHLTLNFFLLSNPIQSIP